MTDNETRAKLGLQPLEVYESVVNNPTKEMVVGFTNEEFEVVVGVLNQGLGYVNPDGSPYDRIETMTDDDREILRRFTRRIKQIWLDRNITIVKIEEVKDE